MHASKDATRPSVLAVNPRNEELSTRRRIRLLATFDAMPEDTRADLLELVETIAFRHTADLDTEARDARDIIKQVYRNAGWE